MNKTFSFWRFVINIGIAKSGTWSVTNEDSQRIMLFSIHTVTSSKYENCNKALAIIFLPFSFIIGYI